MALNGHLPVGRDWLRAADPALDADASLTTTLNGFLADTYLLMAKTQASRWNASGANCLGLRSLIGEQTVELSAAVEQLAERVRALRALTPCGLGQMLVLATLLESDAVCGTDQTLRMLAADHTTLATRARDLAEVAAEADDPATQQMLVQRIAAHDRAAWLLRSQLA
jgi:starvation-inducible DNA-binding protein